MAIEAHVNPTWAWKWVIMAVFTLVFGAWCIYDAVVRYPTHNLKVAAFAHFQKKEEPPLFDATGGPNGWAFDETKLNYDGFADYPAFAAAQGWSDAAPGAPHSDSDIFIQWVQLGICLSIGLGALTWVTIHKGTKLVADDDTLIASNGKRIPFSTITSIDKKKWDSKGIAVVHYHTPEGSEATTRIDDWVYRDGDLVLEQVERMTGLGTELPGD